MTGSADAGPGVADGEGRAALGGNVRELLSGTNAAAREAQPAAQVVPGRYRRSVGG